MCSRRGAVAVLALPALICLLTACGGGGGTESGGEHHRSRRTVDWPAWGNGSDNTHYARLAQVNRDTVDELKVAWSRPGPSGQTAWETYPIVVGRTMFYDTGTDQVIAVDAASGRPRWSYTPKVDFFAGPSGGLGIPVSRGVTYGAGRIYIVTSDARLIALNAGTGEFLWSRRVARPEEGNVMNSPGTYWRGEVIVGGPAGAAGLRGFVAAYDARDGTPLWRTNMVPARGQGWRRGEGSGGGDVWMPPTVDPRSGTVYVSTGNPSPGFDNSGRPGCNPMADAIVAIDGTTGAIEWSRTQVCEDSWDYDTTQSPMLFDLSRTGGAPTRVVGAGSKAGFYSVLEAGSGRRVSRSPYLVRYSKPHRRPTRKGVVVCPGIFGGLEYGPPAYNPQQDLIYQPGNDYCMRYRLAPAAQGTIAGDQDLGGTATQVGRATGVLAALEPASGRVEWRAKLPSTVNGGALSTAGGLVFVGEDAGWLRAFDSASGKELWKHELGLRVGSAPLAYEVNGTEYVAIAAGGSLVEARGTAADGQSRLFVFSLEELTHETGSQGE